MPTMFLTAALLQEPAQRSVRVIAQARLERVLQEAARVEVRATAEPRALRATAPSSAPTDPEAIHDFRVALRRLRAWMRAFRPYLRDTVRSDPERRLRDLSRLAGRARDLEVQYDWLIGPGLRRARLARDAARWLAAEVGRELPRARRGLVKGLVTDLPGTGARLAKELRHYREDVVLEEPGQRRMAAAMGEAVRKASDALAGALQRVRRLEQAEAAHAARIAVKRLRYLLEAFGRGSRNAASILRQLSVLQRAFGELHDAQVLQHQLRNTRVARRSRGKKARSSDAAPSPRAQAALRALVARRVTTAFQPVVRAGRSPATRTMFIRLSALVRRLESTGRRGPKTAGAVLS